MVLNLLTISSSPQGIQNPNPIVYAHCTLKGLQAGIFLGSVTGAIVNLYQMYYTKAEKNFNWLRVGKYARNSIIPFIFIINKMCYDRLSTSDLQKNQSRAYRIHKNQGQNLVDDLSLGGFFGGAAFGAIQGQKSLSYLLITASLGALSGLMLDFGIVFGKTISNRH
ncbi:transmembrane protein, putative (macronuclear) [Tetrahymena thermophila SB210]|uniref:Transmembrane protein, putative n=1 Tax=Tetrahymena thermophila (strain SB210) TaxID=312017 RepID=Q22BQ3_TETTS|nr:transmembrane protein, putative [Tetrahymena thermophila SB210]EAR82736.1 transmembrane protein, putative [Tetrahymena thermophila SB210]|eukprot:XP_001030399.1 transmembrane protein, putative [Tetrahymena thermophila SB210]